MKFETTIKGGLQILVCVDSYSPGSQTIFRADPLDCAEGDPEEVEVTLCWLSGRPMGEAVLSTISQEDKERIENEAIQIMREAQNERYYG